MWLVWGLSGFLMNQFASLGLNNALFAFGRRVQLHCSTSFHISHHAPLSDTHVQVAVIIYLGNLSSTRGAFQGVKGLALDPNRHFSVDGI